ncbi:MAG: spermidine/putrescine ABC transporter substrate-binding protein [Chloroflexota bacterium]
MSEIDRIHWPRRPISRRRMLRGMAGASAAAAFGPLLAACGGATTTPSPTSAPATPAGSAPGSSEPTPTATPEPTPVPAPEGELYVYNWADYIGEDTIARFQDQTGIRVTYDFFDSAETQNAKIATGNSGYDVSFPTSTYVKGFVERKLIQPLDLSLIPNVVNLGAEWQDPGYDPGNAHSMPYMWWTTGVAYDTAKIGETLTSWSALWDERWSGKLAMLDDMREAFAAALIRLGFSANSTSDDELDQALALLQEQKPLLRTYTTDDIGVLSSGDVWVAHAWGADVYQVQAERDTVVYYIPEEGGIRGSDTMVLLAGAQHPIAAHAFINFMLDAEVAAANTNYIGYMGPNAAARAFIDPAILDDPTVNPDRSAIEKLQEILDLGADEQKFSDRWTRLRAGG